jgi:hypothetical protein
MASLFLPRNRSAPFSARSISTKNLKPLQGRGAVANEVLALIPLNLDGSMFNPDWQDWKKDSLASRLAPDFTGWEKANAKFEAQLEKVVKALRADGKVRERPPEPRL